MVSKHYESCNNISSPQTHLLHPVEVLASAIPSSPANAPQTPDPSVSGRCSTRPTSHPQAPALRVVSTPVSCRRCHYRHPQKRPGNNSRPTSVISICVLLRLFQSSQPYLAFTPIDCAEFQTPYVPPEVLQSRAFGVHGRYQER